MIIIFKWIFYCQIDTGKFENKSDMDTKLEYLAE